MIIFLNKQKDCKTIYQSRTIKIQKENSFSMKRILLYCFVMKPPDQQYAYIFHFCATFKRAIARDKAAFV